MGAFPNAAGAAVVHAMIASIHENKQRLSEIDGAIGDGDHGINMDKGFSLTEKALEADASLDQALRLLGSTLLDEIGGSMGPLYGSMFKKMARVAKGNDDITASVYAEMIEAAYESIRSLGDAKPGDKTLVDTLDPAAGAARAAADRGAGLVETIDETIAAAEKGWQSTEALEAKIGRAARLGARSVGVLDAGATSCYLLIEAMGRSMQKLAAKEAS